MYRMDLHVHRPQNLNLRSRNQIREKLRLSTEKYVTSKGAVSHNVLYDQPPHITRYQVRFFAYNYFEYLPTVSTAFKLLLQRNDHFIQSRNYV